MLDITYIGGGHRFVRGKTLRELDQKTSGWGQIGIITAKDGYPFGECHGMTFKAAICDVIEIPDEAFEAKVAEEKSIEEQRKTEREEQKKLLKTDADYQSAKRAMEAAEKRAIVAEAIVEVLQRRTLRGRVRRAVAWVKRGGGKAK